MSRKGVTMAVGVVALIGLSGAYLALKGYNADQEEQEAKDAEGEEILSIDSSALTGLEFTINGEQVSFVQEDGTWKKSDDETFPVDESYILSPISELAPLNAVRKLENAEDISEYGMDEPQNTIRLTDEDGNETEIIIGATNSGTGDDYVMMNGDESVIYTVSSDLRSAFSDDLYDYAVSEEIPYLQASEVTEVTVEKAEGSYELYLEDAVWKAAEIVSLEDAVEEVAGTEMQTENSEAAEDEVQTENGEAAEAEMQTENGEAAEAEIKTEKAEHITGLGRVVDADSEMVNDALADLSGLYYSDYVDHNCEDGSVYGLGEDAAVLTVYWQEEVEVEETEAETRDVTEAANGEAVNEESVTEAAADEAVNDETVTEAESETETESDLPLYETYSLTFYIGGTDELGNYYVQQEGSKEVHTIYYATLSQFLDVNAADWELIEEETEMAETEE